jgi:hypothetical protein
VCRCPVYEEKTSSCHIHEEEGFFKCFRCNFKGDAFIYWQKKREVDFDAAVEALSAIAGMPGSRPNDIAPAKLKRERQEPGVLAPVIDGPSREIWWEACDRLMNNEAEKERIARSRDILPQ